MDYSGKAWSKTRLVKRSALLSPHTKRERAFTVAKKKWRHRQDSNLRRQSPMPLYLRIAGHHLNHSATVTRVQREQIWNSPKSGITVSVNCLKRITFV